VPALPRFRSMTVQFYVPDIRAGVEFSTRALGRPPNFAPDPASTSGTTSPPTSPSRSRRERRGPPARSASASPTSKPSASESPGRRRLPSPRSSRGSRASSPPATSSTRRATPSGATRSFSRVSQPSSRDPAVTSGRRWKRKSHLVGHSLGLTRLSLEPNRSGATIGGLCPVILYVPDWELSAQPRIGRDQSQKNGAQTFRVAYGGKLI
jgi:hypothetical protein